MSDSERKRLTFYLLLGSILAAFIWLDVEMSWAPLAAATLFSAAVAIK